MSKVAFGIDLGTSTSEIAVFQHGEPTVISDPHTKSPIVPSLVAVDKRGRLRIGEEARPWVDIPGHGVREVKRMMGTGTEVRLLDATYRPEEISAMILKKLLTNAEISLSTSVDTVVLSVPANFPNAAREATLNAGKIAGVNVLKIINEPTAAALAFGIRHLDAEAQIVVFDFGGGTLDISVLEMMEGVLDVRASFGDPSLGGKDLDEALIHLMWQKFKQSHPHATATKQAEEQVKAVAERAKIELSTHSYADVLIPAAASYKGDIVDLEAEISREEFNRAIQPLLDRARDCLEQALKAGKVTPQRVDQVILVGGTTYVPAVRELVAEVFGKQPSHSVNPDIAVALGCAVAAAIEVGLVDSATSLVYTDSVPYGLGVQVLEEYSGRLIVAYSPLIQPNTPIPYSTKRTYSLLHPDQREVEIHLFQDHTGTAKRIEEAVDTGVVGRIVDIPPALYGTPHPLEIEFSYDANGVARLRASIPGIQKSVEISYDHRATRMSPEEMEISRRRMRSLIEQIESMQAPMLEMESWQSHPKASQYMPFIERAEHLIHNGCRQKETLEKLVAQLKDALATGDSKKIERYGDQLVEVLMEISEA